MAPRPDICPRHTQITLCVRQHILRLTSERYRITRRGLLDPTFPARFPPGKAKVNNALPCQQAITTVANKISLLILNNMFAFGTFLAFNKVRLAVPYPCCRFPIYPKSLLSAIKWPITPPPPHTNLDTPSHIFFPISRSPPSSLIFLQKV